MATLVLDKLDLTYPDGTRAVKSVDLTVPEGEFCVFLGPSGCGKTSTLRMIAGLENPTGGEIRIDDRIVNDLYPGEREIAMVFQHYALYPNKTVRDHFEMPLKAAKMPKDERNRRIAETAELLRMTDLLNAKPRQLSGGQAQRTAIGRALIRQPKLFLLDEPLTSLDAQLRLETRGALKRLQEDLQITTVYVTHDQEEALSLADTIMVMHKGEIQQIATPHELYANPVNLFVAGFIGTPPMNTIPAQFVSEGQDGLLRAVAFDLPLTERATHAVRVWEGDGLVVAGVRPEDLVIEEPGGERALGGTVTVTELQGDEWIASVELTPGTTWKVRAPRIDAAPLQAGQRVGLRIRPGRLRLFDAASGNAIY
jgi:multiple sugar transport system ATP-binding protein